MEEDTKDGTPRSGGDNFLAASILVAALIIGGSVIYSTRAKLPVPENPANVESDTTGAQAALKKALEITARDVIAEDANAPVTIIEYGDYQCPYCAKFFHDTEPLIRENYLKTGKAKMIYRNMAFLGPESIAAAEAAECAKDQGKFWAYHDAIYNAELKDETANPRDFENNGNLNRALFLKLANDVKLDATKFADCIDQKKYEQEVQDEIAVAQQAGVNSTPAFFVNGDLMKGALPYAQFRQLIDAALASAGGGSASGGK